MKTTPVTRDDLTRSVIAVPPLCRNADERYSLNADENRKLIQHLEGGGVSTLLYGGNANLYNIAVSEYEELLELLEGSVAEDTWVVPSVGPMFGTIMDQAAILKRHAFPTAMILPTLFPATASGVQVAVREFVRGRGSRPSSTSRTRTTSHPKRQQSSSMRGLSHGLSMRSSRRTRRSMITSSG